MNRLIGIWLFLLPGTVLGQVAGDMSEAEKNAVLLRAVDNQIKEFLMGLDVIGDKAAPQWQKEDHLRIVNSFFVDNATIEVSNVNTNEITTYEAPDYFQHLMSINYDQVDIDLAHISTEELHSVGADQYMTSGLYGQVYRGIRNNTIIYEDYTIKSIKILIFPRQDPHRGADAKEWKIKFLAIKVEKTSGQ